jgi:hypothetical protein
MNLGDVPRARVLFLGGKVADFGDGEVHFDEALAFFGDHVATLIASRHS